jgi:hypothetical protein
MTQFARSARPDPRQSNPDASQTPELHPPYPARLIAVWTLGFRQCSFRHAIQSSTDTCLDGFSKLGLRTGMLLSPLAFAAR